MTDDPRTTEINPVMTVAQKLAHQQGASSFWGLYKMSNTEGQPMDSYPRTPSKAEPQAWQNGWNHAAMAAVMIPSDTPDWILDFLATTPHGGWVHPLCLTENHPLLRDAQCCVHCDLVLKAHQVVAITPLAGAVGPTSWFIYHRNCFLETLGIGESH